MCNTYTYTLFIVVFLLQIFQNHCFYLESTRSLNFDKQTEAPNAFPGCLINVINFPGQNINFEVVIQPIILLRYFSFPYELLLYPFELSINKADKFSQWIFTVNLSNFEQTRIVRVQNKSLTFTEQISNAYVGMLSRKKFRLAIKNMNCEANIYLNPPDTENSPYLYHSGIHVRTAIKDPFWISTAFEFDEMYWKKDNVDTVPKYSLLIWQSTNSPAYNDAYLLYWISTVINQPVLVRLTETILFWDKTNLNEKLYIACPYCDPCNPYILFISHGSLFDLRLTLTSFTAQQEKRNYLPIEVLTNWNYEPSFIDEMRKEKDTREIIFDHVVTWKMKDKARDLPFLLDVHALAILVLDNITLSFTHSIDSLFDQWKLSYVAPCFNYILYAPKFRPMFLRTNNPSLVSFPEIGLLFQKHQLRFVSCHRDQLHWIYQMKELVVAFDTGTWLATIMLCIFTSLVITIACREATNNYKLSFLNNCFYLSTSLFDQPSRIFENVKARCVLICFPLMFLIISMEYKGENITNLTLEPELVPFDTFASLVQNKFRIMCRRNILDGVSYQYVRQNARVETDYAQVNGHEAFPIVSELWFEIMMKIPIRIKSRLNDIKHKITERSMFFLNNTEMLPQWNTSSGHHGSYESNQQILDMHMESCNRSAIILNENMAIQLHTTLKALGKPAYYGKDIVNENLLGYKYYGYFPTTMILRIRRSYQTGIIEWWQNYFKWLLIMKTTVDEEIKRTIDDQNIQVKSDKSEAGIYVLSLIPGVGMILATIVFVCFEYNAFIKFGKFQGLFNCVL